MLVFSIRCRFKILLYKDIKKLVYDKNIVFISISLRINLTVLDFFFHESQRYRLISMSESYLFRDILNVKHSHFFFYFFFVWTTASYCVLNNITSRIKYLCIAFVDFFFVKLIPVTKFEIVYVDCNLKVSKRLLK